MTLTAYKINAEVSINGIRRRVISATAKYGVNIGVSQMDAQLDPAEGIPYPQDEIVWRGGYNGVLATAFTGIIGGDSLATFPTTGSISAEGPLGRASRPVGVPPDGLLTDIDGNPIPVAEWGTASTGALAITDGALVKALLDIAGVAYDAGDWAEIGWSMGTVKAVGLFRGQSPLDLIKAIDFVTYCRTFDGADGRVHRVRWNSLPVATPNLVFRYGVNVESIQRGISLGQVVNRVNWVGVDSEIFAASDTVEAPSAASPTSGRPYIPDPPGFAAYDFKSDLLEDSVNGNLWAATYVGEHNRLEETIAVKLPIANLLIPAGASCQVVAAPIGLTTGYTGRVDGVTHRLTVNALKTDLEVVVGFSAEGVGTNKKPIAAFTYIVLWEKKLANGTSLYLIQCDGSTSTDPDGAYQIEGTVNELGQQIDAVSSNGIAVYAWTSSMGAPRSTGDGGARAIFISTAPPEGQTITLTVTDFQGLTGTITKTIAFTEQQPALLRDLWAAITTDLIFTKDGEVTWTRFGIAAVGCCRFAADTFQLAWTAGGVLYRCTTALAQTVVATVTGATAAYITWIYPEASVTGKRCWVGTSSGQVYSSTDMGQTFALMSTIPFPTAITSISESPFAQNDLYATAGPRIYHSYDGINWEVLYTHPNTQLFAAGFESGFGKGFAVFQGSPPAVDPALEASRVRERYSDPVGDWVKTTATLALPVGTWRVAYSYRAAGGETVISPATAVTVAANQSVTVQPVAPLPPGATGVYYYGSQAAGGLVLRRFASGPGFGAVAFDSPAPVGGAAPVPVGTAIQGVAPPTVGPILTAVAASVVGDVDFPVQANAVTLGVYDPLIYVVGRSVDNTFQAWRADFSGPFTFARGVYDQTLGDAKDAVRDGVVEGLIYLATDLAIAKSLDGFLTAPVSIFTLTGGELGKKIGFGALHAAPPPVGNLVWHGGYGLLQDPSKRWVYRLTDTGFARVVSPLKNAPGNSYTGCPMLVTTNGSLIMYSWGLGNERQATHAGNVYRSTDGGLTWSASTLQWATNIQAGPGGVVYALTLPNDGLGIYTVYKSSDNGATWVAGAVLASGVGMYPQRIMPHPIDGNTVIINHAGWKLSTDSGATFAYMGIDPNDQAGLERGVQATYTPSGSHFVWFMQQPVSYTLRRAPATLATTMTPVDPGPIGDSGQAWLKKGSALYNFGADKGVTYGAVMASTDEALTWSKVYGQSDVLNGDVNWGVNGFVPGDATNDWYILPFEHFQTQLLRRAAGSVVGDAWENLTPALLAAFPDQEYVCFYEGAVRIPTP